MIHTLTLKQNPRLARIVLAAFPAYRKHQVFVSVTARVGLGGSYWNGGSRSTYIAVNLANGYSASAPQFNPPQFGGPITDPVVTLPEDVAIVQGGIFNGKPATAHIYLRPDTALTFEELKALEGPR